MNNAEGEPLYEASKFFGIERAAAEKQVKSLSQVRKHNWVSARMPWNSRHNQAEKLAEETNRLNFFTEVETEIQQGDFRLAIHYLNSLSQNLLNAPPKLLILPPPLIGLSWALGDLSKQDEVGRYQKLAAQLSLIQSENDTISRYQKLAAQLSPLQSEKDAKPRHGLRGIFRWILA